MIAGHAQLQDSMPASRLSRSEADARLIQDCLAGRQDAWNELVDRYGRLVYSIARRCRLTASECDDVFQNVFLILHQKLATLQDADRLSSWLVTTTKRECWRLMKGRRELLVENGQSECSSPPSDRQLAAMEERHLLREAMSRLPERDRQLLDALFRESGSGRYEAAAQQLGVPVGSIGPLRLRCFRRLVGILREMGLDHQLAAKEARKDKLSRIKQLAAALH